jgi:acyl-CoA reductase-like NAD-dependent aldehyde dehydrogenase
MNDLERADDIVERLTLGEKNWAATTLAERGELLRRMVELVDTHAEEWVKVATSIKQLPAGSPLIGEEWTSGPWATISALQHLRETIGRLSAGKDALDGFEFRKAPGNRLAVNVMPSSIYDRLLLSGFRADVWLEPGVTEKEARETAGLGLLDPPHTRGIVMVLGAGNIFSIAPLDAIYMLYAENRVVALKLNPITDPLKPVFEKIFAPFIELGAIEILSGSIELGGIIINHPGVSAVHMTGSENTHDAIMWGAGDEGRANKAAGTPQLTKPMSSELGGVAPAIIVPGRWSNADIEFQAQHVATQRLHNSGSNCIAAQLVVLSSDWDQKDQFIQALERALADAPQRPAWYPGSQARVATARDTHPTCSVQTGGTAERTLLLGLDLKDASEPAFSDEYFAPVLGVSQLPGTGAEFLRNAVEKANNTLRGTLGANIIISPASRKRIGPEFEDIIADLRYGTIAINAWTAVGYLTANATWGAFPGHALDDIQSGVGVVHNALLFAKPERTVVQGPFRPAPRAIFHGEWSLTPKPAWFVNNRTAETTSRRLTKLSAAPSLLRLPGVFASALRG